MRFKIIIELDEDYLRELRKFRVYEKIKEILKGAVNISLIGKGKVISIVEEKKLPPRKMLNKESDCR